MCFTLPLRIPNGGVVTYSEKHHRPVAEKYAAEIYDRKHAPLGLVGDNAADQLLAVLLDRAKRHLDQLEHTTNARIHALWQLAYRGRRVLSTHALKWNVERTVQMFEEKKGWICKAPLASVSPLSAPDPCRRRPVLLLAGCINIEQTTNWPGSTAGSSPARYSTSSRPGTVCRGST